MTQEQLKNATAYLRREVIDTLARNGHMDIATAQACLADAIDAAKDYRDGFDSRQMRESRIGCSYYVDLPIMDYAGCSMTFRLLDWADGSVGIIVDPIRRRVWTDFVDGAGASY